MRRFAVILGDAISEMFPPSLIFGRDASVTATAGSATVLDYKFKDCCDR
jgi:hypothetical protein